MTAHQVSLQERVCSVLLLLSLLSAIISIAHWFGISLGDFPPKRALKMCLYLTLMLGFVEVVTPYLRKKLTHADIFQYGVLLVTAMFAQGTYQTMQANLILGLFFPLLGFVIACALLCYGLWYCRS